MPRTKECPRCGQDISDSYQSEDPDTGIFGNGWYCEACDLPVEDEGDDDYNYDEYKGHADVGRLH